MFRLSIYVNFGKLPSLKLHKINAFVRCIVSSIIALRLPRSQIIIISPFLHLSLQNWRFRGRQNKALSSSFPIRKIQPSTLTSAFRQNSQFCSVSGLWGTDHKQSSWSYLFGASCAVGPTPSLLTTEPLFLSANKFKLGMLLNLLLRARLQGVLRLWRNPKFKPSYFCFRKDYFSSDPTCCRSLHSLKEIIWTLFASIRLGCFLPGDGRLVALELT